MLRHVRADIEREPQPPLRLDTVELAHLRAVERRQVAGLADLADQLDQHPVAQAAHAPWLSVPNASWRSAGPTMNERSSTSRARKPLAREQLQADAVRGAFRQRELRRQLGER